MDPEIPTIIRIIPLCLLILLGLSFFIKTIGAQKDIAFYKKEAATYKTLVESWETRYNEMLASFNEMVQAFDNIDEAYKSTRILYQNSLSSKEDKHDPP